MSSFNGYLWYCYLSFVYNVFLSVSDNESSRAMTPLSVKEPLD